MSQAISSVNLEHFSATRQSPTGQTRKHESDASPSKANFTLQLRSSADGAPLTVDQPGAKVGARA